MVKGRERKFITWHRHDTGKTAFQIIFNYLGEAGYKHGL
jgi:hypothetical protein